MPVTDVLALEGRQHATVASLIGRSFKRLECDAVVPSVPVRGWQLASYLIASLGKSLYRRLYVSRPC